MIIEVIGLALIALGVLLLGAVALRSARRSRVKIVPLSQATIDGIRNAQRHPCRYCGENAIGRVGPEIFYCERHVAFAVAEASR